MGTEYVGCCGVTRSPRVSPLGARRMGGVLRTVGTKCSEAGSPPGAQVLRGQEPTPHHILGCGARRPEPTAASRARRPPVRPGAQRTGRGGSHVTPRRPWGSPPQWRPFPHIRRTARPPPTTANGVPLRASRDLCARPHPPISARQAAPAAQLAATLVRQTPIPPTSPGKPRSIQLRSLSPPRRRQRRRGSLALCGDSRPLPYGQGASTLGQARRQRALTSLRLSSTRMRLRNPTPRHQTLGPAPACVVNTQPRPGRSTPAVRAGPWRHRIAPP